MTDLESPKKNNDCYFYYYSTCAKGDNCTFRHEPSALGCETMCSFWKEGKCLNVHCNFRHMELRKNRKVIPCYWESQPVGCLKAHCPFLHQNPRPSNGASPEKSNIPAEKSNSDNMLKEQMNQSNERKVTAVDSLVVNFEEESDNESAPTFSPIKSGARLVRVKTLEEIRLEKVQAESAAYYSYHDQNPIFQTTTDGDDLRQRIVRRIISKKLPQERTVTFKAHPNERNKVNKRLSGDELATILGDESLRKKQKMDLQNEDRNYQVTFKKHLSENDVSSVSHEEPHYPRFKRVFPISQNQKPFVQHIKIKTLAEIRAERNAKKENLDDDECAKRRRVDVTEEEAEVSSTSADERLQEINKEENKPIDSNPRRKIKLRRKLLVENSNEKDESAVTSCNDNRLNVREEDRKAISPLEKRKSLEEKNRLVASVESNTSNRRCTERSYSNKSEEEVLLLEEDDDDYDNVSLKAEDALLDEIDSLLED